MYSAAVLLVVILGAASPADAATPPKPSPIKVEVNGEVITQRDVDRALAPLVPELEARYSGEELEKKKQEYRELLLDNLIEHRLLVQAAVERKIEIDEAEVDAQLEELAKRAGGWPQFLNILKRMDMTLDQKITQVREAVQVSRLLSTIIVPHLFARPEDLKRYYEEHADEFSEPSSYRISQIIIRKQNYRTADEAKKKLKVVEAALRRGEPFAEVARKYSDGSKREEGGDWGFVNPDNFIAELGSVLPHMKVDEVKGPIETRIGFHLMLLTDIKKGKGKPFREVQDRIKVILRKRAHLVETQKFVAELRRKAHLRIFEDGESDDE